MTRALVWESWAFDAWTAIEARDPALAERIVLAIEQYVETGQGGVRKLTARGDLRRLRVGAWRAFSEIVPLPVNLAALPSRLNRVCGT